MKKIQSNCWIDNDETYVQSYSTRVATIDHDTQTVTALGYWSRTTQRHIRNVARKFGYRDIDNFRRIWYPPAKRVSQPKVAMKDGYTSIVCHFCRAGYRSTRKIIAYGYSSLERVDRCTQELRHSWHVLSKIHNHKETTV